VARSSKGPWYWAARKAWYVVYNGKKIRLADNKEEAKKEFHRLMLTSRPKDSPEIVGDILDMHLAWLSKNRAPSTYDWYKTRFELLTDRMLAIPATALRSLHVEKWLDDKDTWGPTFKRGIVTALKAAFNRAVKKHVLDKSPIADLEKPEAKTRTEFLTPEQFEHVLSHVRDHQFRDLLTFLWLTGCRPPEATRLEARHVREGHVVFPKQESKGKKRERVIFLVPEAQEIVNRLVEKNPTGPIFRNTLNAPWHRHALACRFARLKKHTGIKYCAYSFRHSFAHNALTRSKMQATTVAALMGHVDTRQLMQTYGHQVANQEFMLAAASQAVASAPKSETVSDVRPEASSPTDQSQAA
jgi:integrase